MTLLLSAIIAIVIVASYLLINDQRKNRQARRQYIIDHFQGIRDAVNKFKFHLDYANGFFTNYQLVTWKKTFATLFDVIKKTIYENIGLDPEDAFCISEFLYYFENADNFRSNYNTEFVKLELKKYNAFFDNVEGRKLDIQQRTAIVSDEDNNIVIAGAGSGKTTTIVGKVNYIIQRYRVPPEQILLISFTNKSAASLANRINIPGVEAKTFHKFGKDIIAATEKVQPTIFDEKQFESLISSFFKELTADRAYLSKVTSFFTSFLKPIKTQEEFSNKGAYIQYLKDFNFTTYKLKEISTRDRTTYRREIVKSIEECLIANFLLFNGIQYEYEYPYEHDTATQDR